MFDVGAGEILALILLGVIMFGPERIPEFSRKAARVVHYLRGVANQATDQIKGELGPEYADLTLNDLNPKTFIQKHLLNDIQDDIDDIKSDLKGVKDEIDSSAASAKELTSSIKDDVKAHDIPEPEPAVELAVVVPFDDEAT